MTPWDLRYLRLARFIAQEFSKDPSTKVGAVIVRPNRTIAGIGYNGLPRGVVDSPERLNDRETKYGCTVHAELNAILNCAERPEGCTLYVWPLPPCSNCAAAIIQAGVKRVVHLAFWESRLRDSILLGNTLLTEAGVAKFIMSKSEV